eukprot:Gregarina_sp_Poly_1__9458@NODE_593_length_7311_cov_152_329238_g458_i0_p4_GENE_NODE_593_length_7311_cov_152_329238_g458_i0NODE_593_length_7311_cov_152_329238_g458_i0_p4_ORF_typecomplete_len100_score28_78Histone_HNS/PF00816_21/0_094HAUS5/PF14817_6/0_17Rabaptin/PF03528_15/0_24AAA_23/PF13476_6/0_21Pet100/PF09803_9/0_98Ribosomal_L29/PF00831_23/91Ribosomal_L29/PF00831_23/3_8DUF2890/PF11081_8/6_4_NODE_593_length_7311_cov_152_329238_g458_i07981097
MFQKDEKRACSGRNSRETGTDRGIKFASMIIWQKEVEDLQEIPDNQRKEIEEQLEDLREEEELKKVNELEEEIADAEIEPVVEPAPKRTHEVEESVEAG